VGSDNAPPRPAATILGTEVPTEEDIKLDRLASSFAGGGCWSSSATAKSVSTNFSSSSTGRVSLGSGSSIISSRENGSSVEGIGTDAVPPVSSSVTTIWQVALPSPLTTIALSPSSTKAAFSSMPIAEASVCSASISWACSERAILFEPVASKWGTHMVFM